MDKSALNFGSEVIFQLKVNGFTLSANIVTRLRMVFAFIALVISTGVLIGFYQLQTLDRSIVELTQRSLSVFIASDDIQHSQNNFLKTLHSLEESQDPESMRALEARLSAGIATLRTQTEALAATGSTSEIAKGFAMALDQITAGKVATLAAKEDFFAHSRTLAGLETLLLLSQEDAHEALELMSYAASDLKFLEDIAPGSHQSDEVLQAYSRNLISANSITAISSQIEAIVDKTLGLKTIQSEDELRQAGDDILFKLRNITVLLGQISDHEGRATLAGDIFRIRNLVMSENGILEEVSTVHASLSNLEDKIESQKGPIEDILALSQALTRIARLRVEEATAHLNATKETLLMVFMLSAIISLSVIAVFVLVVVEGQINRRTAQLTEAVVAIASGKTDYDVRVAGTDELGRMATALGVFKENAQELYRSNLELEKFAYIAAHDLRSPLRAIQDLTQWTLEDPDTVFSEDGAQNMQILQRRVERLNQLLSDLLEYSRAGKEADAIANVSMPDLIEEISELLAHRRAFEVHYSGATHSLTTYGTPLKQILLNLINNAMKHHDAETGLITVSVQEKIGRLFITVQDDGPGISPRYHDRIFDLFQTLQSRDEIEGSGLGLAIINKLVTQYGGTVQIHSNPEIGRGCRFTFDLPDLSSELFLQKRAA